jgi:hypothetical protein
MVTFFIYGLIQVSAAGAQQCPAGHTWYRPHPRSAYVRRDGTPYSAADVTGHCRPKSKAAEFWWDKLSNGRIEDWPHKKEKFKDWTRPEIESVLKVMEKVPDSLWFPVRLYRAAESATKENPATTTSNHIVVYDSAFRKRGELSRLLTHELAHQLYENLEEIEKTSYSAVAGWLNLHQGSNGKPVGRKFVASDGDLSPDEDFANNVEYFVYEPMKVKLKNPAIYDWLFIKYGDKFRMGKGAD